jgi:FkbM family methyltransferase
MKSLLQSIREKYHPLHRLRSSRLGRALLRVFDLPIWVKIDCLPHPIRINIFRNAAYIGNTDAIEPEIRTCFDLLAEIYPLSLFWDIGANVGFYSYYLHGRVEGLLVTAFEPDPGNLANLKATKRKQKLDWLVIRQEAVSNNISNSSFYVDTLASVTGSLVDGDEVIDNKLHGVKGSSVINVPTTTLDKELERASPDLIKIDVEGAELLVLEGGYKLLSESRQILIIEVKKENLADVVKILHGSYREIFVIDRLDISHPNLLALPEKPLHLKELFVDRCRKADIALDVVNI